ncbi:copper-binding protein [Qipengyuania sp. NPDC077410]|jgi:Cu(I)/Ag(I) efflux system periplasmic protein CusF|uniref:copper-binding protein n=1 Tax=Qipengyuania sp. NPDC077410 TaxID=3364496 RepID=UPI0037C88D60|tara:strand:- start:4595 stop:4993 length:399 start_codon:yes stop_codon:yes gene_type:complete
MRITTLVTLLAAPLALAACDSGDNTEEMNEMPMADGQMADGQMPMDDGDMPMMGSDSAMQTASAEGTVTAIDADAGTITVDHGAVPAIEWPAMTMGFEADEQLRQDVAVGDAISFEFTTGEGGNTITSITKK